MKDRKHKATLILATVLVLCVAVDASSLEYRSIESGDYNAAGTWEVSNAAPPPDWVPAAAPPGINDNVTIIAGRTVWVVKGQKAEANDLTINGTLTGLGDGEATIEAKGNVVVGTGGKVITQSPVAGSSGNITIGANGIVDIDGEVKTGDALGKKTGDRDGGDSGGIDIQGSTVIKTPGCVIETGDAGDGAPQGGAAAGGNGGNSGGVKIRGTGGVDTGVENGEDHHVKIGEPGDGGAGAGGAPKPGTDGDSGVIDEDGQMILVMGLPAGPDHSSMTGSLIMFRAVDSLVFSSMADSSILAYDAICISVSDGPLILRGCAPLSFVAGSNIYISAVDIIVDPEVPLDDLMYPAPTYGVCIPGCCIDRVGDANGMGGDEPTIGDISVMIDAKFITGTCEGIILCTPEADVNQSGSAYASCNDITIGDISILIDYLFITGPSVGLHDCL